MTGVRRTRVVAALAVVALTAGWSRAAESGERKVARFRVLPGATIHLGWTGIAHQQAWPPDQVLSFGLDCPAEGTSCRVGGGAPGDLFGAPIPLSSGGIPACVVSRLRESLGGTLDSKTGCAAIELRLTSRVHLGQDMARPCPVCRDDPKPNDGRRDGRCEGGPQNASPCDAQAASTSFGATSHDCPPPTEGVGDLAVDLTPLGTAGGTLGTGPPCVNVRPGGACPCPDQAQQNGCQDGRCPASGRCESGPYDGLCAGQPFRACMLGSGVAECERRHPGAGACTSSARRCFPEAIEVAGVCDLRRPTYVARFCAAATRAPAINASAGLPGPARLVLPLERED